MEIVKLGEQLNSPMVICLGYFGCMHTAHVALLDVAKKRAKQCGAKVALFTFDNNHLSVLGKDVKPVYTFCERLDIYQGLGVDVVVTATFNKQFMNSSGKQFLHTLSQYNLQGVVCGFDYSCGHDRLNCFDVKNYFEDICSVDVVNQMCVDGVKIGTTLVRKLIEQHDISVANSLLSQPFFVKGTVVHGRGVGAQFGFPTANLQVEQDKLLPVGVFAGQTIVDDVCYKCIVNIGKKPTFCLDDVSVEVHIVGYNKSLYGQVLKVSLLRYLRPIQKFSTVQELALQLQKDKESVL